MKLVEVFKSIQGEGTRSGVISSFIRFPGCNLRCHWCDTEYSYDVENAKDYSLKEIVDILNSHQTSHLCITGGEPLLNESSLMSLIEYLEDKTQIKDIVIETNGACDISQLCVFRRKSKKNISIVMDYKLSTSGMTKKMILSNFSLLDEIDEIKMVVGSQEDFFEATEILKKHHKKGQIVFSPVSELFNVQELAELLLECTEFPCRLSLQLHKYIWPEEERGR